MKDTPIIILNKDRLEPLKMLVEALQKRDYTNITIIDNQTTYQPTLDWYKVSGTNVFINTIDQTLYDTGTFYRLACELNVHPFSELIKNYYVFTDSDVVPQSFAPDDFIDQMISVCKELNVPKVGMGLRIDDLPDNDFSKYVISLEAGMWTNKIPHESYDVYKAGVDTTFAVYAPNVPPLLMQNVVRMGGDFIAKHIPWYYEVANMPADELYYLNNLQANRGPAYSPQVKNMVESLKK